MLCGLLLFGHAHAHAERLVLRVITSYGNRKLSEAHHSIMSCHTLPPRPRAHTHIHTHSFIGFSRVLQAFAASVALYYQLR